MSRRNLFALKLALLAGSVVFALLLVELALRWVGYDYQPLAIHAANVDTRGSLLFDESYFAYDPNLIWRPRPGYRIFNQQGFRGPELPVRKPNNAYWIFTVGDSNTLGWRGERGANWPAWLHAFLRRDSDRFEVVNAGVWGYSTYQGRFRLEEALAYRPNMVLVSFGSNDAILARVPDHEYVESLWSTRFQQTLEPFRLGRLLTGSAMQLSALSGGAPGHRVSLEDYRQNLEAMVRMAREQDVQMVLLTRPYIGPVPLNDRWKTFAPSYNEVTAEIARVHALPLIDLYHDFKNRKSFFRDESHFTAEGHARAARIVYRHLQPFLREEATPRSER